MKPKISLAMILLVLTAIITAVMEGYLFIDALASGKNKTLNILIMLPLFITMVALFPRLRMQSIVGCLLLLYWVPAGFDRWILYIFEILLFAMMILLLIRCALSYSDRIKEYLTNCPWFAFVLYLFAATLTWELSTKIGGELSIIRVMCVLPLVLSVVLFLTIDSEAHAERYLWMILISAGILGLLLLLGRNYFDFVTVDDYAAGSGRLSMNFSIPHVGSLVILPQSASNWYGFLILFAYSIWLFHSSRICRSFGMILCLLYGYVIIVTQGRGGALAAAVGAAIITIYAAFIRKSLDMHGIWIKFVIVLLFVVGGLWYLAVHSNNPYFYSHGISLFSGLHEDHNLQYRLRGWENGINLYLANPILGIGLRGIQTPWGPDTSEILNFFLYNLLSFGLLGFLSMLYILIRLLIAFFQGISIGGRTTRMLCIASIAGMVGFVFGMQPDKPYSIVLVWAPLLIAYTAVTLCNRNKRFLCMNR